MNSDTVKDVFTVYTRNYNMLQSYGAKISKDKRVSEKIVDDLVVKFSQVKRFKKPFESEKHILSYLLRCVKQNIKQYYAIKMREDMPSLTNDERDYWFDFTRNLFDGILNICNKQKQLKELEK